MPRKNLIRTNKYYYHITTRSNHKHWFQLPLSEVWNISMQAFSIATNARTVEIVQFVLMSNHYHLLIKTPNCDIDKFMFWFNKTFSDNLRKKTGQINRMFSSNYKWSLITNEVYLTNVIRYIFQNPVRAGIVNKCEEYPYSTIFLNKSDLNLTFKIRFPLEINQCFYFYINETVKFKKNVSIKKGLRKTTYKEVYIRKNKVLSGASQK